MLYFPILQEKWFSHTIKVPHAVTAMHCFLNNSKSTKLADTVIRLLVKTTAQSVRNLTVVPKIEHKFVLKFIRNQIHYLDKKNSPKLIYDRNLKLAVIRVGTCTHFDSQRNWHSSVHPIIVSENMHCHLATIFSCTVCSVCSGGFGANTSTEWSWWYTTTCLLWTSNLQH